MTTRGADRLLVAAFVMALGAAILLALLPSGAESVSTSSSDGSVVVETTSDSLLENEGPSVLIPLAVPVVLAGVALVRRTRRAALITGSLCLAGCVLALLSIGFFFLPVPVLLLLAARWQSPVVSARVGP